MSHTMKLWERVLEQRLRQMIKISENKFGFVQGKSTAEVIFSLKKYSKDRKNLHMVFTDLGKATIGYL